MYISRIFYENFRNFQSLDLSFGQGFIVLTGQNGAGKTNFLEGIYVGASLRRFPESKSSQFFGEGKDFFRINISSKQKEEGIQELLIEKTQESYRQVLKINHQKTTRVKYTDFLPVVSFVPQDLNLLTHSPAGRRRFLNETLSLVSSQYRADYGEFRKALEQRNELLVKIQNHEAATEELEIWDEKLAEFGSSITSLRGVFLGYLNEHIGGIMQVLSPELSNCQFRYHPGGEGDRQVFLERLRAARIKELSLGSTVVGPHRDDFGVFVGGKEAAGFISRGQMRSITLALKVLEKQYFEEIKKASPIIVLDDVFSEFDHIHQKQLVSFLEQLGQVFLTTAHLEEIQKYLAQKTQIFNIKNGEVSSNV